MEKKLEQEFSKLSIFLNAAQVQQFIKYYELLSKWNTVMNLTAITEYDEVIKKHFIDSLSIIKTVRLEETKTLIDIGTGAGFPGIPLKIVFPHLKITLLDSLNKRIKFLNEVIDELKLEDTKAIHGRAEDYARQSAYREKYDLSVSRAVANLAVLSEYCLPYVRSGGLFIAYKSGKIEEELSNSQRAFALLGGSSGEVMHFTLPGTDIERSFVKIKKSKSTPKKYPRKAGIPLKEPL